MKTINKNFALIVTLFSLTQGVFASEQCAKEIETKLLKIEKVCKKDIKLCNFEISENCQVTLDNINKKIQLLNESIQKQLMDADLDSAAVAKKIREDINSSFKLASAIMTPAQAKDLKEHQEHLLNQFKKLLRKDSQFLTKVHPNGMTSREIYQKFQSPNYQANLVQVYKAAMDKGSKDFSSNFVEAFKKNPELLSAYASNKQDNKTRSIAENNNGFGFRIYTCSAHDMDHSGQLSSFHILLYGRNYCEEWRNSDIKEHIFGPGLLYNWASATALVCLNYGDDFKGVGVTAGAYAAVIGAEVGAYIGSLGTCIKVSGSLLSIGARVGLGAIHAKKARVVLATKELNPLTEEITVLD